MNLFALIVAGGQGSRMKSAIPKQFLELNGKPILLHSMEAFYGFDNRIKILLVLPQDQMSYWEKMIGIYGIKINHELIPGGENRFSSVKNGLTAIEGKGLVAIHDGVRPLVSQKVIAEGYEMASKKGNAIAAVDLKDSIRKTRDLQNEALNRADYKAVQTPQTFDLELIQKAYEQGFSENFTDDASVLEKYGEQINLIEGAYSNIKITTQEDLIIASALLSETLEA